MKNQEKGTINPQSVQKKDDKKDIDGSRSVQERKLDKPVDKEDLGKSHKAK